MRKILFMLALIGLLSAPAFADIVKNYDTSIAALVSPAGPGIPRSLPYSTGFEPADGFAPGYIGGQAGWTGFAGTAQGVISAAHPAAGTQELRISRDPSNPAGNYTGGFSPVQSALGVGDYVTSMDVYISYALGANYGVVLQAPSQGYLSARLEFDWLGDIIVLDDTGSGLGFVDTGVAWTPGVYKNLTIDLNSITGAIDYYYDGSLVYSGVNGVFAGTSVEQVVLYSDNWQYAGEFGEFDNLSVTPEPATLALFAVGALALIRRR